MPVGEGTPFELDDPRNFDSSFVDRATKLALLSYTTVLFTFKLDVFYEKRAFAKSQFGFKG